MNTREELAVAIAAREETKAAMQELKGALDRGRQMLAEAEKVLSGFAEDDAKRAKEEAEKVQQWAMRGSGPRPSPAEPVEDPGRRAAEAFADATRKALAGLDEAMALAKAKDEEAAFAVDAAAHAVIREEARRLASDVQEAEARAMGLRSRLVALGMVWVTPPHGSPHPIRLEYDVINLIQNRPRWEHHESPQGPEAQRRLENADRWRSYLDALKRDPQAQIQAPP